MLLQHLREALHQRAQPVVAHAGQEVVEQAALAKQRMDTTFDGAGLEHPIVAQRFASSTQQCQQDHREGVDQPQPIAPFRRFDMDRAEAHAEPQILAVPQTTFGTPSLVPLIV
jgi:hypothetical protein